MAPRLKISRYLLDKLGHIKTESYGCLYGIMYTGNLLVVGYKSNKIDETLEVPFSFATEVDLCGVVAFGNSNEIDANATDILKDVDITDNPLLLNCPFGNSSGICAHFYIHDRLEKTSYEIVSESEIWKQFVHVRLETRLPLVCDWATDAVKEAFAVLHKKFVCGQVSFHFPKAGVHLMGTDSEAGLCGITGEPLVGELSDFAAEQSEGCSNSRIKKKFDQIEILPVGMFWKPTRENGTDDTIKHAPIINHSKKSFTCLNMQLRIDALSMVYRQTKVVNVYNILVESLCRSLKQSEQSLLTQLKSIGSVRAQLPIPYHFIPKECGHFITLVYPKEISDPDLENQRLLLHDQFFLPITRPFFRRRNAFTFPGENPANGKLINPHEGLNSTVKDGEVSTVQGKYTYYHYMQDSMDDDGWGCAYRSLQTLCSWFWWQGYTNQSIPSHRDIQVCLVKIGDKPSTFINSKQWIGSTEVSFCLETLLGITSRIISVSSGEELANQGLQLATHFKTMGTPIMIGGGVLAHTIIGVDYSKSTGELRFLVLDPHYKGPDDFHQVQSKGWCAWKNCDFWKKSAYYNLCLPQVPQCI